MKPLKILVTGATGNVGSTVLYKLDSSQNELYAGVRDIKASQSRLNRDCKYCVVDFEKQIYPDIQFDAVFLVRPPQLANVKLFKTFLESLQINTKIVFLSVQGADKKAYLPHAKIEKAIIELGFKHVFLRPSYFMENLTTTLWPELKKNKRIYLPSGNLKLNWIAVSDIAEVVAIALIQDLEDEALELCNTKTLGFQEVISTINMVYGTTLIYESPSLFGYLAYSFKQRQNLFFTLVMVLLHYLPKFSKQNEAISYDFERLTGKEPMGIEDFLRQKSKVFEPLKSN